eukprot:3063973-Rhodomonas_salina.1
MSASNQNNNEAADRQKATLDAAAMLDGMEFSPEEYLATQLAEAEKQGLAGTLMMVNTLAILEVKRIMLLGKTMADVMASFRAMRTGERWMQCPPEVAVMRLFSRYPAKDDSEIKKELTAAK